MTPDMETPSIVVEPPREEQDLIDGGHTPSLNALQSFYGMYQGATSSSGNTSAEQGLFSTPLDLNTLSSGQVSPLITTGLRDAQSGNMFLSASGQNSPIEASSPASTSSGDPVFPENWSDCSSQWSPSLEPSSHPSSPSLSPINTSMLNFTFNDPPYLEENFQQAPAANRMRSNSYSGGDSPPEANNGGRPRSASFTNVNDHVHNTFFHVDASPIPPQWDPSFQGVGFASSTSLPNDFSSMDPSIYGGNAGAGFGSPTSPSYSPVNEGWNIPELSSSPGHPPMNYPPPPGPPPNANSMVASHSRSQSTHLTVPTSTSLQRRGAHRRRHSDTGVHEHASSPNSPASPDSATRGMFPSVRRRIPSPSFTPSHSRPSSAASFNYEACYQQVDQSAAFLNINPANQISSNTSDSSSFLSPSPGPSSASQSPAQSPIAPPIELAVPDFTGTKPLSAIKVDDSLIRRHSYGGGGSQAHADSSPETLHRAASDPLGRGRKARSRPRYQGLLRPQKEVDESSQFRDLSMMIDVPVEGIASTSTAASPLSSDSEHKDIVASNKIVDASFKRRKKPTEKARFVCPICQHNFTAKHNLNNHMNSHNGVKPFKCDVCKQTFTTSGTAKRHQNNCTGKIPRKRP
ncbi:hypothetical protein L218DRAFT_1003109 [Marasmius fiardii PR-910]|nr:hypothetical protein L218DRAFT_1003109 [Marasmius fiardii PR-910]